jgi:hypothetical protein
LTISYLIDQLVAWNAAMTSSALKNATEDRETPQTVMVSKRSEHENMDQRRITFGICRSRERPNALRRDADATDQGIVRTANG